MADFSLTCQRSEHALAQPFSNAYGSWRERSTLTVRLGAPDGADGYGEAAPLPGYSRDDLARCERALHAVTADQLSELATSTTATDVMDRAAAILPEDVPAARFALETAALDRLGRATQRPLWRLLLDFVSDRAAAKGRPDRGAAVAFAARSVALCAVLPSADAAAALTQAKQLVSAGVGVFKLKVGPDSVQREQERTLDALRSAFDSSIELRIDANQSFRRRTLDAVLAVLARYEPAFVEEPIERPLPAELAAMPCGFALDESLSGAASEAVRPFLLLSSCRALVLKPTLLGGLARCLELARLARAHGRAAVVSHTLEGRLGFAACAHLALALAPETAAGLWPLSHQIGEDDRGLLSNGRLLESEAPGLGVVP